MSDTVGKGVEFRLFRPEVVDVGLLSPKLPLVTKEKLHLGRLVALKILKVYS